MASLCRVGACVILLIGLAGRTDAADHFNLEEGLPTTVEDAYPIKQNSLELQSYFRFDSTHGDSDGKNRYWTVPRFEWGAFKNFQASVAIPYRLGNASETRQGDVQIKGLYNFNTESLYLPAFSIAASVVQPFGLQSGGTETELKFLATKSIGPFDSEGNSPFCYSPRSLHVNASWLHNYDPLPGRNGERRDRYRIVLGYSQPITNELVLVADAFRETVRDRRKVLNMAEIGARYIITPQTVLAAGVGIGFGGDRSEDFRATLGFQHTLSYPYSFDPPR